MTSCKEVWKDIKGYEGLYQVSNTGKVKSLSRKDTKGRPIRERELSQNKNNGNGYIICSLCKEGVTKNHYFHRLVAEAFIPNPDNLRCVNHIDSDRGNNNLSNLEWVSHEGNMQHCIDVGRKWDYGTSSPNTDLIDSDVISIYNLAHNSKISQYKIGDMFNTTQTTVSRIKRRIVYKKLLDKYFP